MKHIRRPLCNTFPKEKPGSWSCSPLTTPYAWAQEPAPDYDVSRWLYVPKVYSEYRYILGTEGKAIICDGHQSLHRHPGPVR